MLNWEYDQEAEFKAIREDGIEQGIEQVAKNMLLRGTALEIIAKDTGLSIDEIKKLQVTKS